MLARLARTLRLPGVSAVYWSAAQFLAMQVLLRPAARLASLPVGLLLADGISTVLAATTYEGRYLRQEMAAIFSLEARQARHLARARIARRLRDYVFLERVVAGREPLRAEAVRQVGSARGMAVATGPGPAIVVTGHFARQAEMALYSAEFLPGPVQFVSLRPPRGRGLYARRIQLRLAALLRAVEVRRSDPGCFIYMDDSGTAGVDLIRHLVKGGQKVSLAADAAWEPGRPTSHVRPFAARQEAVFSVGAARLARLAQVPLVLCIPYLDERGGTVLEWHDPIPPPPRNAAECDRVTTDTLLDGIESAVAARPDQYVLYLGRDRAWEPQWRQWRPINGG